MDIWGYSCDMSDKSNDKGANLGRYIRWFYMCLTMSILLKNLFT